MILINQNQNPWAYRIPREKSGPDSAFLRKQHFKYAMANIQSRIGIPALITELY